LAAPSRIPKETAQRNRLLTLFLMPIVFCHMQTIMEVSPVRYLYFHGFASSPSSKKAGFFRERIPSLEVPDLDAGDFEHSTITGQLQTIENLAAGESVSLIGSSMGGYLAALYAARHPEVAKLVLMAPAFGFVKRWSESVDTEAWRADGFLDVYHYGEKRNRRLSYGLVEDARQYEDFPDFQQPALIFHGLEDNVVPPRLSREFAASHPKARLHLLASDHELLNVLDDIWQAAGPFLLG
jgi:pimeloyl-ACP methyl ester carboxylesterase